MKSAIENDKIYNRAIFFAPKSKLVTYDKRALWGWDRDNFTRGEKRGVVDYKGFCIGIRICFEIRFPEFFRELYKEKTDLDVVLFYDVTNEEILFISPPSFKISVEHLKDRTVHSYNDP